MRNHRSNMLVRCSWFAAGLLVALGLAFHAAGQERDEPPASLDAELLKDLEGDGLLEGLDDLPLGPPARGVGEEGGEPDDGEQRPTGAAVGDDVGASENLIIRIGRKMQRAEAQIAQGDTGEQTLRLQREIADEIQGLIEQVKQQGSSSKSSSSPSSRRSQPPGNSPASQPAAGQQPGEAGEPMADTPSPDSTDRVGTSDRSEADLQRLRALYKEAWGHLPARIRQRMQSASAEEFLPEYERMIEEYFKRLAEEGR